MSLRAHSTCAGQTAWERSWEEEGRIPEEQHQICFSNCSWSHPLFHDPLSVCHLLSGHRICNSAVLHMSLLYKHCSMQMLPACQICCDACQSSTCDWQQPWHALHHRTYDERRGTVCIVSQAMRGGGGRGLGRGNYQHSNSNASNQVMTGTA